MGENKKEEKEMNEIVIKESSLIENNVKEIDTNRDLQLARRFKTINYLRLYDKNFVFGSRDEDDNMKVPLLIDGLITFSPRYGDIFNLQDGLKWLAIEGKVKSEQFGTATLVVKGNFKGESEVTDDAVIIKSDKTRVLEVKCIKLDGENLLEYQNKINTMLPEERKLIPDLRGDTNET